MARTLQSLLDERASALPGRDRERTVLLELVERERPLFAVVHGIAGVGKSALLRAFAGDARERGARVLEVDCRMVEPTESGFLDALGRVLDVPLGSAGDAADALAALPGRTVIVLDPYERFRLLDTWVRLRLVPVLPAGVRILLADRDAPSAWSRDFGDVVRSLRLGSLAPEDALRALRQAGVEEALAERVNRVARGHPLALQLAAGALAAQREPARLEVAVEPVIAELAELYLASLDAGTRRALDAASVVRRTTVSLLGAMLPEDPPAECFEALRRSPFVEIGREGLVIHDTVREVTAALLRAADPVAHRRYRAAAWRQLRRELRDAGSAQLWRYTADMVYLVEHPAVRDAFFPVSSEGFVVEPARADDAPAVEEIALEQRSPEALATLRAFWDGAPHAFRVARDADGEAAGYACVFEPETVSTALISTDPVTRAWREHRRSNPVPRGQRVLYIRDSLTRGTGGDGSSAAAALWLDVKRDYLEMRPALRRVYIASTDPEQVAPALAPLGFAPLALEPIDVDGIGFTTLLNDLGPASVDGWLSDVVGRELQTDEDGVLDAARRDLVLDGHRVALTRLEFDLLRYLQEREGEAVERGSLLRDVWGYDWTGGSNVIEVVVSAVRRKLGERADALETVRGVGYRLRPLD